MAIVAAVASTGSISATGIEQVLAIQDSEKIAFKKLTQQFEKSVIKAIGNPDVTPESHLRELLQSYAEGVTRIFPDRISGLLGDFQQEALILWPLCFAPEKHSDISCIQDFRKLTHDFERAVINAITDPEN